MTNRSSVAVDLFSGGGALSSDLKATGYRAVGLAEALARQSRPRASADDSVTNMPSPPPLDQPSEPPCAARVSGQSRPRASADDISDKHALAAAA